MLCGMLPCTIATRILPAGGCDSSAFIRMLPKTSTAIIRAVNVPRLQV